MFPSYRTISKTHTYSVRDKKFLCGNENNRE